jgi:hypothetical protein
VCPLRRTRQAPEVVSFCRSITCIAKLFALWQTVAMHVKTQINGYVATVTAQWPSARQDIT